MSYYQKLLTEISAREAAVDCARCTVDFKCCTYRPFIANFLAGQVLEVFPASEELFNEWDFLITGLSPNMKYRKHFFKKGKWGFGTEATLLCSFYDKKNGGCQIWQARPAVCRTFFCKSSYHETGAAYWSKAEEFTWLLEWTLLEDFLFTRGWTLAEIQDVKKYLEEENVSQGQRLPEEYRFTSLEKAQQFYKDARTHVLELQPEYIEEIIGEHGRTLYADLLAQKAKLG